MIPDASTMESSWLLYVFIVGYNIDTLASVAGFLKRIYQHIVLMLSPYWLVLVTTMPMLYLLDFLAQDNTIMTITSRKRA